MGMETRERLELGGTRALEHAGDLPYGGPASGRVPLFRVWAYSAQGDNTSWTLLAPRNLVEGGSAVVREVIWSRRQDEDQLDSDSEKRDVRTRGDPSLRIRDTEISAWDQDHYRNIVARLRPPRVSTPAASSGDWFGIEGYGPLRSLRMEWRGAGPDEWSESIRRVTELRNRMSL